MSDGTILAVGQFSVWVAHSGLPPWLDHEVAVLLDRQVGTRGIIHSPYYWMFSDGNSGDCSRGMFIHISTAQVEHLLRMATRSRHGNGSSI